MRTADVFSILAQGVGSQTGLGHLISTRGLQWGARGPLGVAHQSGRAGEGLAHAHTLVLVQEEGVGLDGQVVLQGHLGLDQGV